MIPIRDWLYLGAIAIIMIAAALFIHHERGIGEAKVEAVRQQEHAQAAAVAASAIASNAVEAERRVTAIQGVANVAQTQAAHAEADAAAAASARDALRVQLASTVAAARRARPADPAASPASVPAGDPIGVLAQVLGETDDFATQVAAEADANRVAGAACERAYGALTQ